MHAFDTDDKICRQNLIKTQSRPASSTGFFSVELMLKLLNKNSTRTCLIVEANSDAPYTCVQQYVWRLHSTIGPEITKPFQQDVHDRESSESKNIGIISV